MKRGRFGASISGMAAAVSSVPTAARGISFAAAAASGGSVMVSIFAGEIDGDSMAGNSTLGCACSDALSGLATDSLPATSIALRLAMAPPQSVIHQSVTTPGYQLVTNRRQSSDLTH